MTVDSSSLPSRVLVQPECMTVVTIVDDDGELFYVCIVTADHLIMSFNWGEPERAPHWLKSVMVSYVAFTDCENDKIRLTSHSSFVMISYVACTDCGNDKIRWTSYVQTVNVEWSIK